jgi:hypothetical protein
MGFDDEEVDAEARGTPAAAAEEGESNTESLVVEDELGIDEEPAIASSALPSTLVLDQGREFLHDIRRRFSEVALMPLVVLSTLVRLFRPPKVVVTGLTRLTKLLRTEEDRLCVRGEVCG